MEGENRMSNIIAILRDRDDKKAYALAKEIVAKSTALVEYHA